jgi:hypothetical protein
VSTLSRQSARIFEHLAAAKVVVNDIIQTEINSENGQRVLYRRQIPVARKETIEKIRGQVHCDNVSSVKTSPRCQSLASVCGSILAWPISSQGLADLNINIEDISTKKSAYCLVDIKEAMKAYEAVCNAFELDKTVEKRKQPK